MADRSSGRRAACPHQQWGLLQSAVRLAAFSVVTTTCCTRSPWQAQLEAAQQRIEELEVSRVQSPGCAPPKLGVLLEGQLGI